MHTCPNCGKDTDAGMTERCTHCGFAPGVVEPLTVTGTTVGVAADPATSSPRRGETRAPTTLPEPATYPGDARPTESKAPRDGKTQAKKKSFWTTGRIAVAILIGFGVLGALSDDEKSDSATGPDAAQVESAVRADALELGANLTIDCPASVDQTPVGSRFTCQATNVSGDHRTVSLTNKSSSFSWERASLVELRRLDRQAGI